MAKVKPAIKKKLAEPSKASVKVIKPLSEVARSGFNIQSSIKVNNAKSGAAARIGAAAVGKPANPNARTTSTGAKYTLRPKPRGGRGIGGGGLNANKNK